MAPWGGLEGEDRGSDQGLPGLGTPEDGLKKCGPARLRPPRFKPSHRKLKGKPNWSAPPIRKASQRSSSRQRSAGRNRRKAARRGEGERPLIHASAILRSLGWLLAALTLYTALVALELYWNLYDWQPKLDLNTVGLIFGKLALLGVIWFLARAGRDRLSRCVSLLVCLALLVLAVYVVPPEAKTEVCSPRGPQPGLVSRGQVCGAGVAQCLLGLGMAAEAAAARDPAYRHAACKPATPVPVGRVPSRAAIVNGSTPHGLQPPPRTGSFLNCNTQWPDDPTGTGARRPSTLSLPHY